MKRITAPMKKINWCVIYLIKVQLHIVQKYMDIANVFFFKGENKTEISTCYLVTIQEKPTKFSFWCGLLCVKYSGRNRV